MFIRRSSEVTCIYENHSVDLGITDKEDITCVYRC